DRNRENGRIHHSVEADSISIEQVNTSGEPRTAGSGAEDGAAANKKAEVADPGDGISIEDDETPKCLWAISIEY
ncbi:hypothetical protein PIB30_105305, partial [Stylosanthes scabra]|nr:hypothetical protein [Stylosanthes scabra]